VSSERTRIAAYALCRDDDGRILLCHIAPSVGAGDLWTLPGGGLEFGESPSAAVLRELTEETGYQGEIDRMHAIRIVYGVRLIGGELRDEPDGSTDTCRWLTLDEAKGLRLGELARRAIDHARAAG
jgi:8-oxo-dGTP diphosphatase